MKPADFKNKILARALEQFSFSKKAGLSGGHGLINNSGFVVNSPAQALRSLRFASFALPVLLVSFAAQATAATQTGATQTGATQANAATSVGTVQAQALQSQQLYQSANTAAPSALAPAVTPPSLAMGMTTQVFAVGSDGSRTPQAVDDIARLPVGSVLEYRVTYQNTASNHIAEANARIALPEGIELVDDGYTDPAVFFASVDGDKFYRFPIKARTQAGVLPVAMSRYKALEWHLVNVSKGESRSVVFRGKKIKR